MNTGSDNPVPRQDEGTEAPAQLTAAFPDFSEHDLDGSIPGRFEQVVRQFPGRLAVKSSHHAWTYAELNRIANRIAHALLADIGPDGAPVALLVEHDTPAIASLMGVLKAAKFYAFLDPSHPLPHNEGVLRDLKASVLLCDRENLPTAVQLAKHGCSLLVYDAIDEKYSQEDPGLSVTAQMPFGVFYTSGSTGQPKGVQRNQNLALHRFLMDTREVSISAHDRQALLTSLTFAGSSSDTYRALLNGASLHLYDVRKFGTAYLAPWLRQEEITYLRPPVALFRHLLASLHHKDLFPSMRVISLGGATLFRQDIEIARKHFPPACKMIHRYSISEGGEVARLIIESETRLESPIVPVGHAIPGKEVFILDADGRELPINEAGQIAVRSQYLAAGYWAQPEQTRTRYMPDPVDARSAVLLTGDLGRVRPDGCLELLGRSDSIVKIRGFRIELAAVEAALRELDTVSDAAVMALPDATGETSVVAYVVPAAQQGPDASAVRRALATRLPEYMLPSAFVLLEALPLTRGGKVDRKALTRPALKPPTPEREWQAPRTSTEAALVTIWSDVLKVERIGVVDDFFELGGHSLLAARVIARVNETFHVRLLLRALYDAPTIAGLAALIEEGSRNVTEAKASSDEAHTVQETLRLLGL